MVNDDCSQLHNAHEHNRIEEGEESSDILAHKAEPSLLHASWYLGEYRFTSNRFLQLVCYARLNDHNLAHIHVFV